ncbi:MAG: complex I subunit 4 family protein [Planctomycetota bacterium]|jgi:NADH-quinone oxidoreductase subunit M
MIDFPIVTALILLPIAGALLILLAPRGDERTIRLAAFTTALVTLLASVPLLFMYDRAETATVFQFTEMVDWVASVGLRYAVGLDGMSLLLVVLTTFLTPIAMLSSWSSITHRHKEFYACMLLLEAGVIGVFSSMDLVLFYVFWEVVLVPMFLIIGIWGGKRRVYASVKFFIYTMVGSLLMLAAVLYVYYRTGMASFDIQAVQAGLQVSQLSARESTILFAAFAFAFAIKVPVFPLHTWLPDAHTEAPTAGSVMLAAVLLKMGTYGLMRVAVPFFPVGAKALAPVLAGLAVIGIIYGALMALAQTDMKRLIAYSSVSHLGFVVLGITAWNEQALMGATYQMLGHGLSTGALFLVVGVLYERHHTREMEHYGGVAAQAPGLAVVFMIAILSSVGLPGLNGFVGEFLILIGTFRVSPLAAASAALGVVFGAVYLLTLYQKVMLGTPRDERYAHTEDLTAREWAVFIPILIPMFVMGIYPQPFLSILQGSIQRLASLAQPLLG